MFRRIRLNNYRMSGRIHQRKGGVADGQYGPEGLLLRRVADGQCGPKKDRKGGGRPVRSKKGLRFYVASGQCGP